MQILSQRASDLVFSDKASFERFLNSLNASQKVSYTVTPTHIEARLIEPPLLDLRVFLVDLFFSVSFFILGFMSVFTVSMMYWGYL